jgi:hypothetical protein
LDYLPPKGRGAEDRVIAEKKGAPRKKNNYAYYLQKTTERDRDNVMVVDSNQLPQHSLTLQLGLSSESVVVVVGNYRVAVGFTR